jgi:uncharacterized protein YacL
MLIPYLAGLIILFLKPKNWHHTFCAVVGNIFAFSLLMSHILNFIKYDSLYKNIIGIIISLLLAVLFLSFDFNKKILNYFNK